MAWFKKKKEDKKNEVNLYDQASDTSSRWWLQDNGTQVAQAVANSYNTIMREREGRHALWREYLGAYLNRSVGSLDEYVFVPTVINMPGLAPGYFRENVLAAGIDAYVAKACANKPRPVCISKNGDFSLIEKAEKMSLGIEGIFDNIKYYQQNRRVLLFSALFDFGAMFFHADKVNNRIIGEWAWPSDIGVSWADGRYDAPRNMIRQRVVSKGALMAMAKANDWNTEAVEHASLRQVLSTYNTTDHPVSLYEAWHLPSSEKATDGMRVLCTSAGLLTDEPDEWKQTHFPCAILKFSHSPMGFGGIGAVEQCISEQRLLDFINDKIRDWVAKSATRGAIEEGSNVSVQQFTDVEGSWIKYKGTIPTFLQDPGPSQALFMERERCKQAIFERLGMSQLFASSKKPAGLDSGKALMEYKDTMSERFMSQDQFYEEYVIDCAELVVECADQLDGYMTTYRDDEKRILQEVKWKDIAMDRDEYQIQIRVAGMLPRDPAGRLQKITEIGQQSPEAGQLLMMFMNDPDTDSAFRILNAGTKSILYDMKQLKKGEAVIPPPFYDLRTLNTAQYLASMTYCDLRVNENTPVDIITNISNYIDVVVQMKIKAQPPPAPLTAAPGGLPAVPMANAPIGPGGPMPPGMPPPGMPPSGMVPQGPMQ